MASSDSRKPITLTPPNQIAKDITGPDNPIPLSPQWLLPKPGETKTGMSLGENRPSPYTGYGDRSDVTKSPGNGEEMHDNQKKRDVFRPTFLDAETGRRDRWRDEERDTNPSARKDRWREGEKEIGDGRKTDRWVDNTPTKNFGEARRAPSDKWADPSKENNYDQRRESKWNTRWGPDDKEADKWTDAGKHGDMPQDKGQSQLANHGKDEREGDNHRPWRPSSLQNRVKAETLHHHPQMTSKEGPTFGHGRGRGDNATFSVGRGRANFSAGSISNYSVHPHSGFNSDRGDNGHEEPSPFSYNRTKLLDIYRLTEIRSSNKILDGLKQVSSLTQEEPLGPLALCAPTPEESAIMKGIDKGDIISSGAPQNSKEGSTGRSPNEYAQSRRTKHGSRDDVSLPPDEDNDKVDHAKGTYSKISELSPREKQMNVYGSNVIMDGNENPQIYAEKYRVPAARDDESSLKKGDEVSDNRDPGIKGRVYSQSGTPWRSPSLEEHASTHSRDWFNSPAGGGIRSKSSDISWSQAPKDNSSVLPDPNAHNELKWQVGEDSAARKHAVVTVDREQETRKLLHTSPDDMLLYYKDPQGQIQGPFSGSDIIGWFEAGYFGIDLRVRPVNAPNDVAFASLGDVMPHLRAKARPPPGFNTAKQSEVPDVSSRSSSSGFGKVLPGPSGVDLLGNEHRHTHGSSTDAENKFLESLMAGEITTSHLERFASSEGLQRFVGQNSSGMSPSVAESGDALNLLAQRMNLERQKSLTQSYPYWASREGAPVGPDFVRNSTIPQANPLSTVGDIPRQSLPQNVEMMSILQGLSDRSSGGVNNGLGGWPKFSVQGGIDPFKENVDLHSGQNFPQMAYGMQQHKQQPQNHPSMTNLLAQTLDNPAIQSDKLLSAGLTHDPQALNLLQQQYLMQLHSQQAVPGPQLSILDKFLLLKQQQKQEEQQQMLRQQQQQQLLSQVLSEQQLVQRFGDPAFGQLQTSASPIGNAPIEQSAPQLSPSLFQANSQVPVSSMPDDRNVSIANMPPKFSQGLGHQVPADGSSLHLPHQMLGTAQKNWPSMSTHADNINNLPSGSEMMGKITASEVVDKSLSTAAVERVTSEHSAPSLSGQVVERNSKTAQPTLIVDLGMSVLSADSVPPKFSESSVSPRENQILMFERTNDNKLTPTGTLEENSEKECHEDVSAAKDAKNVESREVKKTSDKKSRKLKSSKAQPSPDQLKGASKASTVQKSKQSEAEGALSATKSNLSVASRSTLDGRPMEAAREISNPSEIDLYTSLNYPAGVFESMDAKAVCVKPKSLLEIQQEEQKRAQMEIPAPTVSASISPISFSSPWGGMVTHVEPKVSRDIHQDSNSSEHMGKTESPKSKKSGLHDLLAAEVLAKSNNRSIEITDNASSLPLLPTTPNQLDVVDHENFIEAKDTKKSRKKAAKAKASGAKVSAAVPYADVAVASGPVEKVKSTKHVQAEKEVLPAPPSGPSLGDFVPWKGESTSPSPAPAWSSDAGKFPKPTSLRDILKEQGKKGTPHQQYAPISTSPKPSSAQTRPVSWSVSASSPSKAISPVQINSHPPSQTKYKGEDDLFWGPPDQSKQESKQAVFPQLGNQGSWTTKGTPVKGTPGTSINRQKSVGGRAVEHISSSPVAAQVSGKGKRDGSTKHLEAMDFRDWCQNESVRLTGSKDTSFLEFCSKQSRSEAETLLTENLGSFDPNHEFIEKFLNYMELLSADVLELAFQSRNDLKAYNKGARDMNSDYQGLRDLDKDRDVVASADASMKGGKKKGKKGKKVSSAVLGFNVVSNRIMMGEIQTLED
ncbi:hypothetical protein SOVF_127950 [Spinacia oleracea]|nr:hypothetical protein SOVF_127950 [Spinacia oleracea]